MVISLTHCAAVNCQRFLTSKTSVLLLPAIAFLDFMKFVRTITIVMLFDQDTNNKALQCNDSGW